MPKPTDFVSACRAIESAIERSTTGPGGHKRASATRSDLLRWATTWWASEEYPRLTRLRLPWKQWDRKLAVSGFRVAGAVHLLGRKGASVAQALRRTDAARGDLDYVLALAKELGVPLYELGKSQHPKVETELAAQGKVVVWLEERALEDMLLSAAEGRKVAGGRGQKYTEVFGICFGSQRRSADGDGDNLQVNVSRMVTQMRAKATANEVSPNWKSLATHIHIGEKFFPHLEVVGDYHTHPYDRFSQLVADRGWEYSRMDENSLDYWINTAMVDHGRPHFSLVVAVASGGKRGKGTFRRAPNVVQVSVDDLFFVVGAYRIRLDCTYDRKVRLEVPAHLP